MTLAGIGIIPAAADETSTEPSQPSGGGSFLDLTSPRFWVLVAVMVAAFALLGMWLASRPSPEQQLPQEQPLEAEDVESPVPVGNEEPD